MSDNVKPFPGAGADLPEAGAREAMANALEVLEAATSFTTKKARDKHASTVDGLRAALATHPAHPRVEAESRCANCGKPASEAEKVISEYPEDGEWFCSDECHDQHSELGCPHEHHDGYRHPAEARRLIECEEALRSLASWLGVGGYNAPAVDAKEFEAKIRDGVEHMQRRPRSAAEGYLAMWGPLLARAQAGAGGVLSDDDLWKNDALMAVNAELGLPMVRFGPVVRAIAAALSTPAPQAREPAEPVAKAMAPAAQLDSQGQKS